MRFKNLLLTVCFILMFMVIGTVGMIELGTLSFKVGVLRCLVYMVVCGLAFRTAMNIERKEG